MKQRKNGKTPSVKQREKNQYSRHEAKKNGKTHSVKQRKNSKTLSVKQRNTTLSEKQLLKLSMVGIKYKMILLLGKQ